MSFGETLRQFGVKVSLDFDAKKFEAAQDKVEKFGSKLRGFAFEVSALSAGVFEFQNLFTSNARSLQNQADLLGVNTVQLQEYEYAAKVAANANREDLVGSLQTLADTMDKARAGDLAARQALEQIGGAGGNTSLILGRLNDRTYKTTDAFRDLSLGISNMAKNSPQAANRLTEMTLGSSKLYNLLRQGPKVIDQLTAEGKKNFALTEKQIKQGYLMDIQMSKLWLQFRKLGYEIGFNVMKHLTPLINQFTKWFQANKEIIGSGIVVFIKALADGLQWLWQEGLKVIEVLGPIVTKLGGAESAIKLLLGAFLAFKAIGIAASFVQLGAALATAGIAIAPMVAVAAAIGAVVIAIHDLWTLISGGKLEDTWIGQLINGFDKLAGITSPIAKLQEQQNTKTGAFASLADFKAYNVAHPQGAAPASAAASGAGGAGDEYNFNTTQNITLPPGTSAAAGSGMITAATIETHDQMMIKAKQDSARNRAY